MRLMRDLVGEILSARYRLIARVAGGGMGDVYRGHDLLLDRPVAVKILQPSLAADPEFVTRFKQEARAAARLSHPNVVAVHDWGRHDDGTYYMVMEYVSGTDLRDLLVGRGALQPAQTVDIMTAVCDALSAAHRSGLVHRDVKPENILVARDGTVKVTDFGIAVVADADRTSPGGAIPGTLRYLSPEQAAGGEATPASDIWAAGAVLAEALTGRPPLLGSGAELLRRRAEETPVPPSAFDPAIPQDLDAVVLKACAVEPAARYADASQMAADLRRVAVRSMPDAPTISSLLTQLTGEIVPPDAPTTPDPPQRRRKGRVRRVARGVAVAMLAAALAFGALGAGAAVFGPREVPAPSLVGLTQDDAVRRAERAGLVVDVSDRRKHSKAPKGEVLGQLPVPRATVEEGSTVTLFVSAGLPSHPVPPVVGLERKRASRRLDARGLRVGDVSRRFSEEPAGTVIAQEPDGGRLRWGRKVHLVVSKGPRPVEVPNVYGMTGEDAVAALEGAGLTAAVLERHDDKVDAGVVLATQPAPGSSSPPGTEVTVVVSKGPELRRFKMPDVRGSAVRRARARLERLGLVVEVVQSCGSKGQSVVETDPVPGTRVTEGDGAALFVC